MCIPYISLALHHHVVSTIFIREPPDYSSAQPQLPFLLPSSWSLSFCLASLTATNFLCVMKFFSFHSFSPLLVPPHPTTGFRERDEERWILHPHERGEISDGVLLDGLAGRGYRTIELHDTILDASSFPFLSGTVFGDTRAHTYTHTDMCKYIHTYKS